MMSWRASEPTKIAKQTPGSPCYSPELSLLLFCTKRVQYCRILTRDAILSTVD
jgi:hypothetical protein